MRDFMTQQMRELAYVDNPHYRTGNDRTPIEKLSAEVGRRLVAQQASITAKLDAALPDIRAYDLYGNRGVVEEITAEVQRACEAMKTDLPSPHLPLVKEFLRQAVLAVSHLFFAHVASLYGDANVATVSGKRQSVVDMAQLLSKYPAAISANVRNLLSANLSEAVDGDDWSQDFAEFAHDEFTKDAIPSPEDSTLDFEHRYCPAHEVVGEFAGLVFDLLMHAYRHHSNTYGEDAHARRMQANIEDSAMANQLKILLEITARNRRSPVEESIA